MNSALIFLTQNIAYFFIGLVVVTFGLLVWIIILHKKWQTIFHGSSGDLDEAIRVVRFLQDSLDKEHKDLLSRVGVIESELPKNIQKIGLVRYNPFSDAGGDQSFALALLNEQNDGIVLSSLYGREMNRVYSKPIEKGTSKYQLSDEEKQAIQNAR